ncbi:MAG: 3-isopropylmalate dehydratase large subunit [Kofleriaceae bacterium]|nr:3-isopropylmalate dehydratase large subunit [Kofleriaceae bacterium]
MSNTPKTLFDKVWQSHIVVQEDSCPAVFYIDLHLIHEVTSPQAFAGLKARGLPVRRKSRTVATMDHVIPTLSGKLAVIDANAQKMLDALEQNCREHDIVLFAAGSGREGIVHVIGPELGLTQPGMTIVCGDSHTATHGAFGAFAFGIGTSEVEHVLATQCLLQEKPKTLEVVFEGMPGPGVTAKDIILALCAQIGIGGATGHVIEYRGRVIDAMSMDERMTICNMSIEVGARAGMIAPDETTFAYLKGRESSPAGNAWDKAVADWELLKSDAGAEFDKRVVLDLSSLAPMLTYGTNPGMGMQVDGKIPNPDDSDTASEKYAIGKALDYMGLEAGQAILGQPIDVVFIGSCTNSRMQDLRDAASILKGAKVHPTTRTLIVPGSAAVKAEAERTGLDKIFIDAGAEWRNPGCSMCIAMNGDALEPGQYAMSTSNRNFEGRQGKGGRTFLASPLMAAAAAIRGCVTDVRELIENPVSGQESAPASDTDRETRR